MKTIIYIFLSILVFNSCELKAQYPMQIDTTLTSYYSGFSEQVQFVNTYKITNKSNEQLLTWISLMPIENKSNAELIREYFKKRKGDFNLIEMMNENLLTKQSTNIGYSFIKNIDSGDSFSYNILKTDSVSTFYESRIVIVKTKEVEKYLNMHIEKKYFFTQAEIMLKEN